MEQPNGNQKNNMAMQSNPNVGYEKRVVYPPEGQFTPGYRFVPTDVELLRDYLMKKGSGQALPKNIDNIIKDGNVYSCGPEQLYQDNKIEGEKIMYLFTPRERKYPNGTRPSRSAGDGYWKATGADTIIGNKESPMGYRKALVYYEGTPKESTKTNWIMHEYRIEQNGDPPNSSAPPEKQMRLDAWVLCKIYKKVRNLDLEEQPPLNIVPHGELPNLVTKPQPNQDPPLLIGSHPPPINNTNISTMSNFNGQTNDYGCGDHIYNQDLSTGSFHGLTAQPLFMDDEMLEYENLEMTMRQDLTQFVGPNLPDYDFSFADSMILDYPEPLPSVPGDKVGQFKL